ncbi:MAG: Bax inhibitor-1/YccA family protein [Rhodospirillales bacterium]|nr:Bax inhibitor-1/YccA family protein [Alphaproteobacteria bacterium]MCY4429063.1 Bax inhibitor-1/YccA family protein [Rhodospirillales bacterium]
MALGHYTNNSFVRQQASQLSAVDAGLRSYMLRIYGYMTAGLGITGVVALAVSSLAVSNGQLTSVGVALYTPPLAWVVMFAPLGVILLMSFRVNRMRATTVQTLFWVLAACYGISLSSIFLVYTGESIVRVFFIAASMFLAMSVWGYTTKRSLSGMGSFLFMGMIGIFIAMLVNLFLASTALQFTISVLGVLIFAGLTAYDTQKLKEMYVAGQSGELVVKQAVMGALSLYLDFLMIFVFLLQLLGNRE